MNFLINKRMHLKHKNINFRQSGSAAGISFSAQILESLGYFHFFHAPPHIFHCYNSISLRASILLTGISLVKITQNLQIAKASGYWISTLFDGTSVPLVHLLCWLSTRILTLFLFSICIAFLCSHTHPLQFQLPPIFLFSHSLFLSQMCVYLKSLFQVYLPTRQFHFSVPFHHTQLICHSQICYYLILYLVETP